MQRTRLLLALAGIAMLSQQATAQDYAVRTSSIDAGAATLTSGAFDLRGTIGQPDASSTFSGAFSFQGGFFPAALPRSCTADFNNDGNVNILDVIGFVTNWNAAGPGADFNADGSINILDVIGFIQTWNAGCA